MRSAAERAAYCGIFLALAFGLSYVEMLLPLNIGIPGVKLGLANIPVMVLIYIVSPVDAIIVSVLRVVLSSLLFGNVFSLLFSMAGALISFIAMCLAKKKLSLVTTSIIGAVAHNIGQFAVGLLVIKSYNILYYLPVLIISGVAAGLLTSVLTKVIINVFEKGSVHR